jgi:pimeloyl-ACP methyl ester carboxylesterase
MGPLKAIFSEASPRFKQMFMYMAGLSDEEEFDMMVERMDTAGYAGRINCPTLFTMGEYDPLCHLEAAVDFFEELTCPKELWVLENEFHRISLREGIGGIEIYSYLADWLRDELNGKHPKGLNRTVLIRQKSGAGPYDFSIDSLNLPR